MFEPLLAKSSALTVPEATLLGHTGCVLAAIESLFGRDSAPTPLAVAWLRFFGIPTADFDRFLKGRRSWPNAGLLCLCSLSITDQAA